MSKQVDVLIIGQGICGTFLSLELERAGLSYVVTDEMRPFAASRVAAGLINPVTGRRLVTTWMIDELLSYTHARYGQLTEIFGAPFLEAASVTDLFPTAQMRLAFLKRFEEDPHYLQLPVNEHYWSDCFHYELGYGVISPCYLVDMPGLLAAARKRMLERGILREERFVLRELEVKGGAAKVSGVPEGRGAAGVPEGRSAPGSVWEAGVSYRDIDARWVIFCDGIESFENPYFSRLPFAPNKGEVLIVDIPELAGRVGERGVDGRTIFKKGISLAPWRDNLFWVGSSYEWSFEDAGPTVAFREKTERAMKEWIKLPFRIADHLASVRPATLERRPFVGLHPVYPAVGILNGMGTKGCSLAPYFARQLVEYLSVGSPIQPEADILRFTKVLSRG
jgi:glycine/D-amino acid oxidase-like deaminating enzyme